MTQNVITYQWPRSWMPRRAGLFPISGLSFSISRYTGKMRKASVGAAPWTARLDFSPFLEADGERDWKKVRALLMRVSQGHRVALFDPSCTYPRGVAAGINMTNLRQVGTGKFSDNTLFSDETGFRTGSVSAWLGRDHARGEDEVLITGLVASQAKALVVGDALGVAGYLHSVLATVPSNASGQTLVPIWPPLRVDVIAKSLAARVNFEYPTSPFVLADNNFAGFDVERPSQAAVGMTFVEDTP